MCKNFTYFECFSLLPFVKITLHMYTLFSVGCGNSVGWYADGGGFDPHVRQHSFVEFGHEDISGAILSLPVIQEGQLSVTAERMCSKYR